MEIQHFGKYVYIALYKLHYPIPTIITNERSILESD